VTAEAVVVEPQPEAPELAPSQRRYSPEIRRQLAEAFEAAPNRKAFAKQAGIHEHTLRHWMASPHLTHPDEVANRAREFRLGDADQIEHLDADGTWRPYPNNAFRGLLTTPGFELGQLGEMLTAMREEPDMARFVSYESRLLAKGFRKLDGQVQRLGPDGWAPYVPFAKPLSEQGRLAPAEEVVVEKPVTRTQEVPVVKGKPGRKSKWSEEQRRELAEGYVAAADKREFAKQVGVLVSTLGTWARRPRATGPKPAKPEQTRLTPPARKAAAAPDLDTELAVLRQLLELPADARDRIVAYLTARR
jgi:transposase-like protein